MHSVIFDNDIGIDDAMALLLLHYAESVELLAITTRFGNASIADTTCNALIMKDLFDIEAPVFRGAAAPMGKPVCHPEHSHPPKKVVMGAPVAESPRCSTLWHC